MWEEFRRKRSWPVLGHCLRIAWNDKWKLRKTRVSLSPSSPGTSAEEVLTTTLRHSVVKDVKNIGVCEIYFLTAKIVMLVFWGITAHWHVGTYRRFGGIYSPDFRQIYLCRISPGVEGRGRKGASGCWHPFPVVTITKLRICDWSCPIFAVKSHNVVLTAYFRYQSLVDLLTQLCCSS
jgi:hypothetical protein